MSAAISFEPIAGVDDSDFHFEADPHAYYEAGVRRISLTQAMSVVGLIDYSHVPAETLARAAWRGKMVHLATAEIDRGIDVRAHYEIPEACQPYVEAWELFVRETGFIADSELVEKPRIATIAGMRVGMTPDTVGLLWGVPTILERKSCRSYHPAWAVQTAGQDMGLSPPLRRRHFARAAVQLLPTGKYKLWPHDEDSDYEICRDAIRLAAWKLKHCLVTLG
jgi:hypothetical protein